MKTIGVRIVDEDGVGVEGMIVRIWFSGLIMGGYAWGSTDGDGWTKFDTFRGGFEEVSVKNPFRTDHFTHVSKRNISIDDEDTFSFTLPSDQR